MLHQGWPQCQAPETRREDPALKSEHSDFCCRLGIIISLLLSPFPLSSVLANVSWLHYLFVLFFLGRARKNGSTSCCRIVSWRIGKGGKNTAAGISSVLRKWLWPTKAHNNKRIWREVGLYTSDLEDNWPLLYPFCRWGRLRPRKKGCSCVGRRRNKIPNGLTQAATGGLSALLFI